MPLMSCDCVECQSHLSHCLTQPGNGVLVNLELLSHDISYAVSSIPGLNKYFLLLFAYILIH